MLVPVRKKAHFGLVAYWESIEGRARFQRAGFDPRQRLARGVRIGLFGKDRFAERAVNVRIVRRKAQIVRVVGKGTVVVKAAFGLVNAFGHLGSECGWIAHVPKNQRRPSFPLILFRRFRTFCNDDNA